MSAPLFMLGRLGVGLLTALVACGDPLKEDARDALGPETPGIPEGPLHRAGQPCLVCHDGTTATRFSVAGTIHAQASAPEPAADVRVKLVDARGATYTSATSCAGNFFVRPGDYEPQFPMWVAIERDTFLQEMESPVNGDGSCASCHAGEPGPRSAGRVYLLSFDTPFSNQCP